MTAPTRALARPLTVKNRLGIIVALFSCVVVCVFLIGELRSSLLAGVRAYVGGESLWSKAEKNAVRSLIAYSQSHSESDYRQFLQDIAVPLGDRKARLELQKPAYDHVAAAEGFLQGRNSPRDIGNMIWLFRRFHDASYMAKAIAIWTEGDTQIDRLLALGTDLRQEVASGHPAPERLNQIVAEIGRVDATLTPLEDQFSFTLGEGGRFFGDVADTASLIATLLLLASGIWLSIMLVRQVRRSEERYRHLFATANDAILVLDLATESVLEANARAAEYLACNPADLTNAPVWNLFPQHQHQQAAGFLKLAASKGHAFTDSLHLVSSDRRKMPVEASASRTDLDGREVVQVMLRDIRDRQSAEEALRHSEQRFRSLIQNLSDILLVVNAEGRLIFGSPSFEQALGRKLDSARAENLFDFVHEDDATALRSLLAQAVARRHDRPQDNEHDPSPNSTVFRCRRESGSLFWLEAACDNLFHVPAVAGLVLTARDVTERRVLEEEVRQAQKMEAVGRLGGGIAHDFNNLLMVIQGHAELLQVQLADDPAALETVKTLLKATRRASGLTRRLLAFSRKETATPKVLDLNAVVLDVEPMIQSLLSTEIRLQLDLDPSVGHVHADPGQIEQCIFNLVVNARDAMPDGGTLRIATSEFLSDGNQPRRAQHLPAGRYILLAVSDTGCGMNEQTKERIFDPFFTTKPKEQGTGLGLSVVYGIVQQSGGSIHVSSEVGRGSTFDIFLPVSTDELGASPESYDQPASVSAGGVLLVVEDEPDLRAILCDFLKGYGYTVLQTENGEAALELSETYRGRIDLLLTDVMMPGMRGPEMVQRLTRTRPEVKVLYMSGYTETSAFLNEPGGEAPAKFLQKPFRLDDLLKMIEESLTAAKSDALHGAGRAES